MTTMISTTTIAGTSSAGATLAFVVVLLLIGFLVPREIMASVPDERARAAGRVLGVGGIPLLITFFAIVAAKLLPIFGAIQ
jgi:hypothetical protein